jgi:predicted O-linked N-acetylglucosamine transferase (SPINDLY family)
MTTEDFSNFEARSPAAAAFFAEHYDEAIALYEVAIAQDPTILSHYWWLGLAQLLAGYEEESQMTWMTPFLEVESDTQHQAWTDELASVLHTEAVRQEQLSNIEQAWAIRYRLWEIAPQHLSNYLQWLGLSLQLQRFDPDIALDQEMIGRVAIALDADAEASPEFLSQLLGLLKLLLGFNPLHPYVQAFYEAVYPTFSQPPYRDDLSQFLVKTAIVCTETSRAQSSAALSSLAVEFDLKDVGTLFAMLHCLQQGTVKHLEQSIDVAQTCLERSPDFAGKITAAHALMVSLMKLTGRWNAVEQAYETYKTLVDQLLQTVDTSIDIPVTMGYLSRLLPLGAITFYIEDEPIVARPRRNQMAAIAQQHLHTVFPAQAQRYRQRSRVGGGDRPLKIGYLSACFHRHSVGWLSRWLLKHHDAEAFDVHLYTPTLIGDHLQQALIDQYGDRFHITSVSIPATGDRIAQDEIDILVELDSLTTYQGCAVSALKPAPIQVNWLGYDASGLPAVDYFIADPYVLPDDAQTYYREKIWRLPQTYIAVDGFEIGTPTLRREDLGIPMDAVVYLSSQTGLKRNPRNVKNQLQILRDVPNSYFLVKSIQADTDALRQFFDDLAKEVGVRGDRIRLLPNASSEEVHRANLGLADIVLDTYPYNGATTSLEALWVGLPIVTHVGQQFAARNTYTMLKNVGITEGIAWSDEEYVDWGIRLGQDEALRQSIHWRLIQSRKTAPLWNATQFTREMEQAYRQMWEIYTKGSS